MTTPTDLERRLRDYARLLDNAADAHESSPVTLVELSPATIAPRRTRGRMVVGLALAATLIGMVVFVAARSDDRKVTLLPGAPSPSADSAVSTSPAPPTPTLAAGTWRTLPPSPLSPRAGAAVVWTGEEYIVWGGRDGTATLQDGAAYNPTTNSWRSIAPNRSLDQGSTVVWTGSQMAVLANRSGATYDPATDTWTALPSLSYRWLGQGFTSATYSNGVIAGFGAILNSDRTSTLFAATLRIGDTEWKEHAPRQQAEWWPGVQRAIGLDDGAMIVRLDPTTNLRFDPSTGTWSPLPDVAAPDGWEVTSTVFTSLNGKLAALVGLRRSDTPMPTIPRTTVGVADNSNVLIAVGEADDFAISLATFEGDTAQLSPPVVGLAGGIFGETIVGTESTYVHDGFRDRLAVIDPSSATILALPPPPGRHGIDPAMAVGGNQLFVWGGDLGESSVPEGDTNVSGDGSLWIPAGGELPAPAPVLSTTSSAPPALPTTAPAAEAEAEAGESQVLTIDVVPWAFDLDGIEACEPETCPSVATMVDGTVVVYRGERNELTIGYPGRVVSIAEPLADGHLIAIGPDDVAYLTTRSGAALDSVGDIVAVALSGNQAGEVVGRQDGVVDPSGDTDLVATPAGIVGVGCCGGDERPGPGHDLLMPWVDRSGTPTTSELPWVAIRRGGNEPADGWEVVLIDDGEQRAWRIPRSANGFRGMPWTAVRPDRSVALAWHDPIEGTQRLSVFKLNGTIEEITVEPERWVVLLDAFGAITFDGSRFQRWSLPSFSEPVDAIDTLTRELGRPELTGTSPAALIAEIVEALQQPDGCDLAPSARVVDDGSGGTATIEYRYGCDDSGAGANYELRLIQRDTGEWIIETATQRGLCLRGASGTLCV